jgi:hypothetical protein
VLVALAVVLDGDPDLVDRVETDVEGVLHIVCVVCVVQFVGSVLETISRMSIDSARSSFGLQAEKSFVVL